MATGIRQWSLTLPSDLRLLSLARAFLEAVCHSGDLSRDVTDAVVLAAHEAIGNAMRHAHHGRPDALLQLHCTLEPDYLEIQVLDEGEPFDLAQIPRLNPAEVRLGGRGVFLMRALMDELSCQPRGPRGNAVRMVKRCRGTSPAHGSG